MGLRVQTNVSSLSAQRHLRNTNDNLNRTLNKLSSGKRIARSADDAAGLAVSEKMRAQIRSVRQAVRNANDGVSMIQTAEGAMNEIANILIRFRELSIQAASDTIGNQERGFLDKEVQHLKSELDRIAQATEFNGHKLLASDQEPLEFQIGTENNPELDRFSFDRSRISTSVEGLGLSDVNTLSKEAAQDNLGTVDSAIQGVSEIRAEMGASQNRLQASINNLRIYDENISAARSRIVDADIAVEASDLVKHNILAQAGTAVLSQANQNAQLAVQLL